MTVQSGLPPTNTEADGIQTTFQFNFKVLRAEHLSAIYTSAEGVDTDIEIVSSTGIGEDAGGSVTFAAPPADGGVVSVDSTTPLSQIEEFSGNKLPPETVERGLDAIVIQNQRQQGSINRSLRFHPTDTETPTLPPAILRTNKLIGFNAAGTDFEMIPGAADIKVYRDEAVQAAADATDAWDSINANLTAINAVVANEANINIVAGVADDVASLGPIAANITAVANNNADVSTVADDIASVVTVAGSIANVNLTGGSIANVNTVAGSIANVNAIATNITSVNAVANVADDVVDLAPAASAMINLSGIADQFGDLDSIATAAAASADEAEASASSAAASKTQSEAARDAIIALGVAYAGDVTDRIAQQPASDVFAFEGQSILLPGMSFARSGAAFRVNKRGFPEAVNGLRQNFDPVTHSLRGWKIEGSETNIITSSNDLTGWSVTRCTATENSLTATSTFNPYAFMVKTASASTSYVLSAEIESWSTGWASLFVSDGTNEVRQWFNASTGEVGSKTGSLVSQTFTPEIYANGAVRFAMSAVTGASATTAEIRVEIASGDGATSVGSIGDAINVRRIDFKQGHYPTSYIETDTIAVTRPSDQVTLTAQSLGVPTDGTSFSVVIDVFAAPGNGAVDQYFWDFSDGTTDNEIAIGRDISSQVFLVVRSGGAEQVAITSGAVAGAKNIRACAICEADNFNLVVAGEGVDLGSGAGRGVAFGAGSGGDMPVDPDTVMLGNRPGYDRPGNIDFIRNPNYENPLSVSDAIALISFA